MGLPFSADDCSALFEAGFAEHYARADPKNYAYDAAAAGACLATAREFYGQAGCDIASSWRSALDDALDVCDHTFGGKVEPGEQCTDAVECAAASDESVACSAAAGVGSGGTQASARTTRGADQMLRLGHWTTTVGTRTDPASALRRVSSTTRSHMSPC